MPRNGQRLLSAGASGYFTKPIDVAELLHVIDNALSAAMACVAQVSISLPGVHAVIGQSWLTGIGARMFADAWVDVHLRSIAF
ncbi:MAG TPA: hypothetical protein VGH11_11730 [Jatrophihabitans sp.]|jgi:hypothetical protein